MKKPDIIVSLQYGLQIAENPNHGYDQEHRNGPDYDCSSFIGTILEYGGFNVSPNSWTGNLRNQLLNDGFRVIPIGTPRRAGDIFLTEGRHVVMCVDSDRIVHACINENGGITGGKSGDQTGSEICVSNFYTPSYGWQYHFRTEYVAPYAEQFNDYVAGYYFVNGTSWLNVREKPGTTNSPIKCAIPSGRYVHCDGYYTVINGTKWLHSTCFEDGTLICGYISSKYLTKIGKENYNIEKFKVVNTPWLNVREGVGASTKWVTAIPLGTVVEYTEVFGYSNSVKWVQVHFTIFGKEYTGFCSTKYLKEVTE